MLRFLGTAILITATLGFAQTVDSPHDGLVLGVVLDDKGMPVADATVFVGTIARGPSTHTDAEGKFVLGGIPPGVVGLHAYKKSDGYPYDIFAFFDMPGEKRPYFEVKEGKTTAGIVIQLGARAAYLSLDIADESGNPIETSLTLTRPDLGKYGDYKTSAGAHQTLMVPPVPFRLQVEADGFRPWHYGSDEWLTDKGLIKLNSGATLNLSIRLRPIKQTRK
jgi:hypothetical protein